MFIVTLVQPDRQPHRLVICNTFAEAEQQAHAAGAVGEPTRLNNHDTRAELSAGANVRGIRFSSTG
jgi:hypothetical protein